MANKCSSCGIWNADGTKFCRNCGAKLTNDQMGVGGKIAITIICIAVSIGIEVALVGIFGSVSLYAIGAGLCSLYYAIRYIWNN